MKRMFVFALIAFSLLQPVVWAKDFLDKKKIEINQPVPDFELPDIEGRQVRLADLRGKIVVIHFWSAKCPFVLRYAPRLDALARQFSDRDVVFLGINSNSTETLDEIQKAAAEWDVPYPILIDSGNVVADVFGAITTPHVFILDRDGNLVYEGAVDDQGWSEDAPVKTRYVEDNLNSLVAGSPLPHSKTQTFGCTIKRAIA